MAEADEVKLLADAKKLAMPERCAHTNWKVRNTAYEEVRDACKQVYDENDPCLAEYGELILLLMISVPLSPDNQISLLRSKNLLEMIYCALRAIQTSVRVSRDTVM